MSLIATETPAFEPIEAGEYLGRCISIIDLGLQPSFKQSSAPRPRIGLEFEVANEFLASGEPRKLYADYATSNYGVEMSPEAAEKARKAFFQTYPSIYLWHQRTKANGRTDSVVRTQSGLIRDFSKEPHGFRLNEALNMPIQGSGAECLLAALARLPKHLAGLDAKLVNHAHDEVILEVSEADTEAATHALAAAMQEGFNAIFPESDMPDLVEAKAGKTWAEAK